MSRMINRNLLRVARFSVTLMTIVLCLTIAGCRSDTTPSAPSPLPIPTPEQPTTPVTPTPNPNPPLNVTTVKQLLDQVAAGEGLGQHVILEGWNIRDTSDNDEKIFSDGTGEVQIDYPSSNIPPLFVRIRVRGTVSSSEVDADSWEAIPEL